MEIDNSSKRVVIAITGASGAIYSVSLLKALLAMNVEIYCIQTIDSKCIFNDELGVEKIQDALSEACANSELSKKLSSIKYCDEKDFYTPPASGSFYFDAMAIAPCSMKTLGKIANSIGDNLIIRAAEVALKERRRLVLVVRETPLALTHLRNMTSVTEAGAIVLPACPAFYTNPKSIDDIANFIAARTISAMGFKQNLIKEWGNEKSL